MSGLELARPEVLWGLGLGLPIVLFHLYARRRQRVVVPFVGLLREALGPARPRARFRHLRESLSLLLRLLALAAAVLALAGLRPASAAAPPVDLVVVVDADVTTGAIEANGERRLAQGLSLAAAWVRHHAAGRVGAVLAAEPVALVAPPTQGREELARRLRDLAARVAGRPRRPGEAALDVPARTTTDLAAAVKAAEAASARRGRGRVVVITARPLASPARPGVERLLVGMGRTRADQGFDDLAVRPTAAGGARVRAHVSSDAAAPVTRRVLATLGGETVFDEVVRVDPEHGADLRFEVPAPAAPGAWLGLRLPAPDALAANDAVQAWIAPRRRPSVLVVRGASRRAFAALAVSQLGEELDLAQSGFVTPEHVAEARPRDVVIVDGVGLPPEALRPGAYVFLAPLSGALPFDVGPALERPLVWRTVADHPLVRWLDFSAADVQRGVALSGAGLVPLAFADGRAVIAEGERAGVRYVALGLDPGASYLAVQTALPLFLRRAILRLAAAPVTPLRPFYRAGEPLRPRQALPGGPAARLRLLDAPEALDAAPVRLAPAGPAWGVPAGRPGRVEVTTADPAFRGRTAFVDFAPGRTIVPERPPGTPPSPREARAAAPDRWRTGLILAAVLLLLLDLVFLPRTRRAART